MLDSENTFDLILSHTGPHHINKILFMDNKSNSDIIDEVAILNDDIHKRIQFNEWWCGHWHRDKYYFDTETKHGYQYLYKATKILEKTDYGLTIHNEYGNTMR